MRVFLLAVALVLPPQLVLASLVTIGFEGVVVEGRTGPSSPITPVDTFDLLPPIAVGDHFSGSFMYDDSVLNEVPPFTGGYYDLDQSETTRVQFEINGASFAREQPPRPWAASIEIAPHREERQYEFEWIGECCGDPHVLVDRIKLAATGAFITSEALVIIPDFSLADHIDFSYTAREESDGYVVEQSAFHGLVSSMRVLSVVPEPSPAVLLATLSVLGAFVRRRHRSG